MNTETPTGMSDSLVSEETLFVECNKLMEFVDILVLSTTEESARVEIVGEIDDLLSKYQEQPHQNRLQAPMHILPSPQPSMIDRASAYAR